MDKQYRIEYLDLLRIVSIFFVIVVHVTVDNWYVIGNNPFNWLVNNSYNSISRWAVPVFIMISGTIFLREEKEMPIVKIYTKYVFKIVVLLFVWGIIYDYTN